MLKKTGFLLFLCSLLAGAWFFSIGSWNQISRYDAIMSFVEPPFPERPNPDYLSFRIDHFILDARKGYNTGDWAQHDGHFYSNKAPGPILLGTAVYLPLYWMEYCLSGFQDNVLTDTINAYMINFFVSVLPTALSVWALFYIFSALGAGEKRSAFWTLVYALGTPVFCYSTMMWGHTLAAACFIFAVYAFLKNTRHDDALTGLFCGAAVLSEYLSAILVPIFGAMIFMRAWNRNALKNKERLKAAGKHLLAFAAGGFPMLVLYAVYHKLCFGSFLTPATVFNNPQFHDAGLIGGTFGFIRPVILLRLLFSQYRGIFFYTPLLLCCIPGFRNMFRKNSGMRSLACGLSGIAILTLIAVSGFNGWHGGITAYSRYLIPILPALIIPCVFYDPEKRFLKYIAIVAFFYSFCCMLLAAYTAPLAPKTEQMPIFGYVKYVFTNSPNTPPSLGALRMYEYIPEIKEEALRYSAFSIGELFTLSGCQSIILFCMILTLLLFFIFKSLQMDFSLRFDFIEKKLFHTHFDFTFSHCLLFSAFFLLFLFPGTTLWINDEPEIINSALQANDNGMIAKKGLCGSFGLHYAPIAIGFYQLLLLLTSDPVLLVTLKTLLSVLAICWAVRRIAKAYDLDWKIAVSFLFASPYIWHYTRILWDNVFLFPLGLCLFAFLLEYMEKHSVVCLCGAAFCGMCMLPLHPMSFPVVAPLPLIVLLYAWNDKTLSKRKAVFHTGLAGLIAGVPPLIYYLSACSATTSAPAPNLNGVCFRCYAFIQHLSGQDFIDHLIFDLIPRNSVLYHICSVITFVLTLVFGVLCMAGIFFTFRRLICGKRDAGTWLCIYAIIILIVKVIFDLVIGLKFFAHYQTPGVPAAAVLLFAGTAYLKQYRESFLKTATLFLLLLTCCIFATIHIQEGSRSFMYGALLSNQYEVAGKVFHEMRQKRIALFTNSVSNYNFFPHALNALLNLRSHEFTIPSKQTDSKQYEYELRHVGNDPRYGAIEFVRRKEIIPVKNKP